LGNKVVIGFLDRIKGVVHKEAHRWVSIPIHVETIKEVDVDEKNISLLCVMGLHRKNIKKELDWYLSREIVDKF